MRKKARSGQERRSQVRRKTEIDSRYYGPSTRHPCGPPTRQDRFASTLATILFCFHTLLQCVGKVKTKISRNQRYLSLHTYKASTFISVHDRFLKNWLIWDYAFKIFVLSSPSKRTLIKQFNRAVTLWLLSMYYKHQQHMNAKYNHILSLITV